MIEKILEERIKKNEELFNKEEIADIQNNLMLYTKIYLLGIIDMKL